MDGLTMLEFHRHSNAQIMCPLITIYLTMLHSTL
ncbi:unnamed protein product [Brassica rapa subsp. trilocularis]